jgi:prepilin-type N-terminal cleavage/methylation domain-containing protein
MRGTKAVTLTELILVLVIIAIGAAAAMPSLGKGLENSKMKSVQSSVRYLRDRVMLYAKEHHDGTGAIPDGTMPVLTSDNPHNLKNLFDAKYLMAADLAFYKDLGTGIVLNYCVRSSYDNIAAGLLYKVCGTFDAGSSRSFCINQNTNGGQEVTASGAINTECPES